MPRVAIVIPSQDFVCKGFAMSLAAMTANLAAATPSCAPVPHVLVPVEGALLASNRNRGTRIALDEGADFVMFVDSDMTFPPWILRRLLHSARTRKIVGATYRQREAPFAPVGKWARDLELQSDGLHEVTGLGFGAMVIARGVFERLGNGQWFKVDEQEGVSVGEDYYFCHRAREVGFKVWMDMAVSNVLGHIGRQVNYLGGAPVWHKFVHRSSCWIEPDSAPPPRKRVRATKR